jgi:predicted GIY-YIG superfamily endonuclease
MSEAAMPVDTDAGDVLVTGSPSSPWCVYVLECEWRRASQLDHEGWKHAASKARKRVYVGSTNDLDRRMAEHIERTAPSRAATLTDGSIFTQEFPPKKLLELHFVESEPDARRVEEERARDLERSHPGWFVWQS